MEEVSLGKITRKYFFKMLIWMLLIDIIFVVAALGTFSSKFEEASNSFIEGVRTLNSLVTCLIIINVIACVVPPLMATRKIKKKYVINDDNKKKVFRNVAIILCIMAVIFIGIHIGIKSAIYEPAMKSTEVTEKEVKEELKDIEEFAEDFDIEIEEVDEIKKFFTLADIYVIDGLVLIAMIGVEYFLIVKKGQKE